MDNLKIQRSDIETQEINGQGNITSLIQNEVQKIKEGLLESISSTHPVLDAAAKYLFQLSGKYNRPMTVLLVSQAACNSITDSQRKLAEIAEIVHVASLIHDDIIDNADNRRGGPSLHRFIGSNKIAVLAGDFLLARASILLANLGNIEVIKLVSTVIEHLAHGEVWQMAFKGLEISNLITNLFIRKRTF